MSSIPLDQNGDCVDDIPVQRLLPPDNVDSGEAVFPQIPLDCYDAGDEFGEPEILPRIGDEYQAELPALGEPNHMPYSEVGHHSLQDFIIGLPVPLTWISCPKHEGPETISDSKHPEFKNVTQTGIYCSGEIEPSYFSLKPEEELQNLPAECGCEGHRLVPGLLSESWSDAEKASFLLALYIFEKNFIEVRRFVETKDMGAILSFFYGSFYGLDEYRRWSEGRKTRSKKCVYGQRIFSGFRQQELLSRLMPRVSEECKSALLEVSKTYGDDKMSLIEYVSSLKAIVGMNVLVEAVAIGKGKQDLTGMGMEPLRSNQAIPVRPEIPAGKACSSLSTSEIIKFLSGDYRLSKARSNDLFWEAVWPRLLARGWHSEQPQNQGYIAGSKHFLVFLVPGVKKFSRRKLIRGDHYFDSITDVLSKVAKEPGLIELENEEGDASRKEDHHLTSDGKLEDDENNLPTRQRHSYLQPRTPNRSMEAIKFTIVDTSLSDGNVRELRSLPSQISNTFIPLDRPEESDESDSTDTTRLDVPVSDARTTKFGGKCRKSRDDGSSCQDVHTVYPPDSKSSVPLKNKDVNVNKKPRKASKSLLGRKQKQGTVDNIAPMGKRCRRLTANGNEETRDGAIHSSTAPRLENGVCCCSSGVHESNENLSAQVSSCQDKLSSTSSSKGSPCESIGGPPISNIHATEPSPEKPRSQLLIDLNLPHPQASPEFENDGLATNSTNEPDDQSTKQVNQSLPNSSVVEARTEEQAVVNPRRLSTRYRPPTTRALEAVANGFLTVPQRRKGRDTSSHDAHPSRPSQRSRGGVGPNESPSSSVASQVEEAERGASSSGTQNTLDNSRDPPEANEESQSRQ